VHNSAVPVHDEEPPPPCVPTLLDLMVRGAERLPSGVWYQEYRPGGSVTIDARLDPPQLASASDIVWDGGEPHSLDSPLHRVLSLGVLTPFGAVLTVRATLSGVTKSVHVKAVPKVVRLDVSGAERLPNGGWRVDPGVETVVVRAITRPSVPEACRYLRWIGIGSRADTGEACCCMVSATAFTAAGPALPVDVTVILD